MSKAEIIKQLPKLSRRDRREIARLIFEIEDDQKILADSDQRANERFLVNRVCASPSNGVDVST